MTNHDKNTRTLIVCFVLLILALVPLRFTEIKNGISESRTQVLGDEVVVDEIIIETPTQEEGIVLPNAEIQQISVEE